MSGCAEKNSPLSRFHQKWNPKISPMNFPLLLFIKNYTLIFPLSSFFLFSFEPKRTLTLKPKTKFPPFHWNQNSSWMKLNPNSEVPAVPIPILISPCCCCCCSGRVVAVLLFQIESNLFFFSSHQVFSSSSHVSLLSFNLMISYSCLVSVHLFIFSILKLLFLFMFWITRFKQYPLNYLVKKPHRRNMTVF